MYKTTCKRYNLSIIYTHTNTLKEDLIMKLSKLILTTVAATFLLTSISADATVITRDHRTFKGNGTPASEALAKKCQTIWDEYEELDYQRTLLIAKHVKNSEEKRKELSDKIRPLHNELVNNRCL